MYTHTNMKKIVNIIIIMILTLSCTQKYPFKLGNGYNIDYDGNSFFCLLDKNNTVIVQPHITTFNFDSTFIIVEQKPVDLIYNNPKMNLEECDKLFEKSSYKQYWIIDKTKDCKHIGFDSINQISRYSNVFGPYTKNEFILKSNILGVSKKLKEF